MAARAHDRSDPCLPPILAVDARIEELSQLDVSGLASQIALDGDQLSLSRAMREAALIDAIRRFIDYDGWKLSWDPRGLRLTQGAHTLVLGTAAILADYLASGSRSYPARIQQAVGTADHRGRSSQARAAADWEAAPTTVFLVDDHALVREGIRGILETQHDLRVVGEARDSASAISLIADQQPDIVLLDTEIPGGDATTNVRRIRDCSPRSRVIIISIYEGPELIEELLAAGIHGYLLKSVRWQELVTAIRAVAADKDRILLDVSRSSLRALRHRSTDERLSVREREVLTLVSEALSNRQIAVRLSLTEATVKRHLRNIFVKLDAVSRMDAVKKAAQLPYEPRRRNAREPCAVPAVQHTRPRPACSGAAPFDAEPH